MRFLFPAVIALLLCTATAVQAMTCYSANEFEAEQGLRIHSELMVIGLTCAKEPSGKNLYGEYQTFTRKNQELIASYEVDMISFFRQQGDKNPEKSLHALRTQLANKIAQHAVKMNTVSFCKNFASRIEQALTMDHDKLRRWAKKEWKSTPTIYPVCS